MIERIHEKAKEGQVSIEMFTLIELLLQYFNKKEAEDKLLWYLMDYQEYELYH